MTGGTIINNTFGIRVAADAASSTNNCSFIMTGGTLNNRDQTGNFRADGARNFVLDINGGSIITTGFTDIEGTPGTAAATCRALTFRNSAGSGGFSSFRNDILATAWMKIITNDAGDGYVPGSREGSLTWRDDG
jgi:hypothetical protein